MTKDKLWRMLALNIKEHRLAKGLTQQEMADLAHISFGHYRKIEAPNVVSPFSIELLLVISNVLEVDISDLFKAE